MNPQPKYSQAQRDAYFAAVPAIKAQLEALFADFHQPTTQEWHADFIEVMNSVPPSDLLLEWVNELFQAKHGHVHVGSAE